MDLVNSIVNFNQAATMSKVQFAVAKKLLDTQSQQGAAVVKLIQSASNTSAQAGDQLTAAATGLGGELDIYG